MRRILLLIFILAASAPLWAQHAGIKTNTLLLGTGSPNLGMEFSMGKKFSFNVEASYNPFKFGENRFWKHVLVLPELRWWYCHRYAGSFWGLHGIGGKYNVVFKKPEDGGYRYQGNLIGGGLTYGYSWILANHWNMEATLGVGYVRMNYDKYECGDCGEKIDSYKRDYFGPTKAAVALIYYF